jgi:WD40 repeat protein
MDGRSLLATASDDGNVRIWMAETGELDRTMEGHVGWVRSVCVIAGGERTLLASAGADQTVRIWNPADGKCWLTIPVRHPALSVRQVAALLAIGHDAGVLAIELSGRGSGL